MASIYGVNNNISGKTTKTLVYSIVNYWKLSGDRNYDNGDYKIFIKENFKTMLSFGGTLIHHYINSEFTESKRPACIVDVRVFINPDDSKFFIVGDFKPVATTISNTRPERTKQYYIDIISPHIPSYSSIF